MGFKRDLVRVSKGGKGYNIGSEAPLDSKTGRGKRREIISELGDLAE